MSKKEIKEIKKQNKEFLNGAADLFKKWQEKHGYKASLICSVSIYQAEKIPEEVADFGYEDGDDELEFLHTDTYELESPGVRSFHSHARNVIRALNEYRDGSEDLN